MLSVLNSMRPLVSRIVYTSLVASLTPVVWAISVAFEPSSTRLGTPSQPKGARTSRRAQSISSSFDLDSFSPSTRPSSPLSSDDERVGTGSELGGDDSAAVALVMPWLVGMEGKELEKEGVESESILIAPSTSSSDLELSPSSSASSKGLITPSSSSFGPLPIIEIADATIYPSAIIENVVISQGKEAVVVDTITTLGLQPFLDIEPIASPSLERPTTPVSPPTIEPATTIPSVAPKNQSRNARNKKAQPKKVKKEVVVAVAPPSPPPVKAANKTSSKARSRKGRKKSNTIPATSSVAPQVVVVVEEEQAQSNESVVRVEEVEVVASPPSSSHLPTPSPPRFNRPRSSTSPTTPLETVLAEILVQYQDPDYSFSLDDELTSITISLPFFLDLAAKAASPNTFSALLDLDKSTFPSLPSVAVPMDQTSLQFELNEDGKIVPWYEPPSWRWSDEEEEEEEEADSEISKEKGLHSRFTGYRHVLFEEGLAMAFYDGRRKMKSGWDRAKVGGSPLRWGWVGEE